VRGAMTTQRRYALTLLFLAAFVGVLLWDRRQE
jgi:hypothetical protein